MKKLLPLLLAGGLLAGNVSHLNAAEYVVDTKGAHAFINFKIKHLGYSWLTGRFNTFTGSFEYDERKPNDSSITIDIDTTSFDSNHAERDKHIRSGDFLNVAKFPTAKFESTQVIDKGDGALEVKGKLTLHGVTKDIVIDAEKIGEGKDPWGNYRAGFSGTTTIRLGDYNIPESLGPASRDVLLELHIEGIRQ